MPFARNARCDLLHVLKLGRLKVAAALNLLLKLLILLKNAHVS